jgi:hypothetical protein
VNSWPVAGTIHIGDRPRYRRVVVEHVYPRRIVVERRRGYAPYRDGRWRRNARTIVVYYDRHCNQYFDRYRRGLEEMRAYAYDGRIYQYDDDRDYHDYDRRNDGYRRDGWGDRYDRDRRHRDHRDYDDRDHGSWEHDH